MSQAITDDHSTLKRGSAGPRVFQKGDRVQFSLDTSLGRTKPMVGTVYGQNAFGFVRVDVDDSYSFHVPACDCRLIR